MRQVTQNLENLSEEERQQKDSKASTGMDNEETDETEMQFPPDSQFDGLLMTPCSARSHPDYVKFMAKYQVSGLEGLLNYILKSLDCHYYFLRFLCFHDLSFMISRVLAKENYHQKSQWPC